MGADAESARGRRAADVVADNDRRAPAAQRCPGITSNAANHRVSDAAETYLPREHRLIDLLDRNAGLFQQDHEVVAAVEVGLANVVA